MIHFTLGDIARITQGTIHGNKQFVVSKLITDSRNQSSAQESLFIAIKGKQHDSHSFIKDLYEKGFRAFLIEKKVDFSPSDAHFILVKDSILALQQIATAHRALFDIPVIGITGSNGKTIIKEWLYYLLSNTNNIVRSPKSYNSQIGVPLSVSLLDQSHELAIFEAGISEPGEMERLEPIIKPNIGIFTNIGSAHQEYFKSISQKVEEKSKLFKNCQTIIYSKDNNEINNYLQSNGNLKFCWSLVDTNADVFISGIQKQSATSTIHFQSKTQSGEIEIPFSDNASIENAIHCLTTLIYLKKLSPSIIHLFNFLPPIAMRLELKEGHNNTTIINDSYNSDLESIKIALNIGI